MGSERILRTAYRLALRRGMLDSQAVTAEFGVPDSLETFVAKGLLDPHTAERLEAEASLLSEASEEEEDILGLFPLRHTERYRPELYLGDGGMGRVFRAYDTLLKRHVALKFFRTSLPQEAKVFQREAQSQARIDHPHVARVFEAGELEGIPYLSMQFIHGPTLAKASPDLPLEARVEMARQACLGLHAAHRLGIIHRDIKPGNIMLERDDQGAWQAFVMDFGLARDLSDPTHLPSTTVMGTPAFMAPEQVLGPAVLIGPHTDIYAMGVTLFQLATGALPFPGDNHAVIFRKLLEEEAPPLRALDPSLPADLEAIVQRCMEKDVFRRYDSILDLAEDLQRFLEGTPVKARPIPLWRRLSRKVRRNPGAFAAGGVALLLAGGWLAYARWSRARTQLLEGRISSQGADLTLARTELERLRLAQAREQTLTRAFQEQVAQARTPTERTEAEQRLKESLGREQALAAKVAQLESRPAPAPVLARPEPPPVEPGPSKPAPERPREPARPEPEAAPLAPPQMIREVAPVYPAFARSSVLNPHRNADVSVLIQVQLDASGAIQDLRVESGVPGQWGYNEAAVAAVRASTFAPAQRGGRPVAGTLPVKVTFRKVK